MYLLDSTTRGRAGLVLLPAPRLARESLAGGTKRPHPATTTPVLCTQGPSLPTVSPAAENTGARPEQRNPQGHSVGETETATPATMHYALPSPWGKTTGLGSKTETGVRFPSFCLVSSHCSSHCHLFGRSSQGSRQLRELQKSHLKF